MFTKERNVAQLLVDSAHSRCHIVALWKPVGLLSIGAFSCELVHGTKNRAQCRTTFFDNAHSLAFHGDEQGVPAFSEVLHRILSEVKTRDNKGWHEALQASRRDFVQPKVARVPHEARRASRSTETKRTASPRSWRARRSSRTFFFETMIDEGRPCNEQRVTKRPQTNKNNEVRRARRRNQLAPHHARRKEVRNEHDGTYKQSLTLGQGRICTGLQNALPKAVGGNLQGACNWTCNEAGSAGPINQLS